MPRTKIDGDTEQAARALIEYLSSPGYRPVAQRELLHRTHVTAKARPAVRRLIARLLADGRIHKIRGGRIVAALEERLVRGVVERHRGGVAKVVDETEDEEVVVASRHLAEARPGDRVSVRVVGKGRDGVLRGVVVEVLASRGEELFGVFMDSPRGPVIQPFDPVMGKAIHVPAANRRGARDKHAVRYEIVHGQRGHVLREARVLEVLGHVDEPGTDSVIVARKRGLPLEFPSAVLEAASRLPRAIGAREAEGRERFDDPAPVTIDGETAKDFDDAIAVEELPRGGFRLFVHIADVGHFVEVGGELDVEAARRGTSVYFPDRVLPMFPEQLSNDLCSLRPGEDRLVQSVVIDLTARGKVRCVRFADGVIRSAARLTYGNVAEALEKGKGVKGVPARLLPMLRTADRLRDALERRRHARGSIDFDLPEPQILLDVEGVMTGITIEPRNLAHLMIEEFMLLANEVVAEHLQEHRVPSLYRVHDSPSPEKLAALTSFVEALGFDPGPLRGEPDADAIQALIESVAGRPEQRVISQVVLQSMQQARYSVVNSGHFGLGAPVYSHFTSPIRRYPDLVVHRQLRAMRSAGTKAGGELPHGHDLEAVATSCSTLERTAEAAERELLAWKKVAFIESRVGETFDGVVTGVTRFGLFVQLVENLVEGLIRVDQLGAEWFEFDAGRFELRGSETATAYRLGDPVRVRVDRVDRVLQRVDFSPTAFGRGAEEAPGRRQPRRGRSRSPGGGARRRG